MSTKRPKAPTRHDGDRNSISAELVEDLLSTRSSLPVIYKKMMHMEEQEPVFFDAIGEFCKEGVDDLVRQYPTILSAQPRIFTDILNLQHVTFLRAFELGQAHIRDMIPGLSAELRAIFEVTPPEKRPESFR